MITYFISLNVSLEMNLKQIIDLFFVCTVCDVPGNDCFCWSKFAHCRLHIIRRVGCSWLIFISCTPLQSVLALKSSKRIFYIFPTGTQFAWKYLRLYNVCRQLLVPLTLYSHVRYTAITNNRIFNSECTIHDKFRILRSCDLNQSILFFLKKLE